MSQLTPAGKSHAGSAELRARGLIDLQRSLSCISDLEAFLNVLAESLPGLLPVRDRVSIAFVEEGSPSMRVYRLLPAPEGPRTPSRVRMVGTVVGDVARDGRPRVVKDVRADRKIAFGQAAHDGIRSTASVPIVLAGRIAGVLNAGSRSVGRCNESVLEPLADVAAIIGPALLAAEALGGEAVAPTRAEPALVGCSKSFEALLEKARRAARSEATVLLTGETGVGKTALARAIHEWSARRYRPFVPVHMADLPATLVESELFGHERGAFTGAAERHEGRFERARGGTIFLDEIGEAPQAFQSKLLRVLQDGRFERVGGGETLASDVRVIAATHRDLAEAVAQGTFREDLYYRLDVIQVHVAPLRERPEDLEPLVAAILAHVGGPLRSGLRVSAAGWERLRAHSWPGNVRELESVLRRAVVLEEGDELRLDDVLRPARPGAAVSLAPAVEDWPTRDENERRYLRRVLEKTGGIIEGARGAATLLGLQPSTLRSRLKRLKVEHRPPQKQGDE